LDCRNRMYKSTSVVWMKSRIGGDTMEGHVNIYTISIEVMEVVNGPIDVEDEIIIAIVDDDTSEPVVIKADGASTYDVAMAMVTAVRYHTRF